ncbi:DUF3047 domain-containing protein [Spongiibacter nanhainus]|uniref:DUF3047 domain-containing protein n=1 Tax=Spongiibacter nanhainus TaxID=2794344 RepID=A0A7T4QYD8_9GAMM|nr:DUF3047 domain-containing protein [Spongiibacter nanhainus]QQD16922.1 DUF3047 domain-containing protein [Spongiibacter nanhainus]
MSKLTLGYRIGQHLGLVGDSGTEGKHPAPTRNAPSPLTTFPAFIRQRRLRRQRRLSALNPPHELPQGNTFTLRADGQWLDTGLVLGAGDNLSLSARGRLFLSKGLEVSISPRTCVWYRIGDGEVARLPAEHAAIHATTAGTLLLQVALPGSFDSPAGDISTDNPPPAMSGAVEVTVSQAPGPATPKLPPGWHYHWKLGKGSLFTQCEQGEGLCCDTQGDVGIIQYPVDIPLSDKLQMDWCWRADTLPSELAEHLQPTHDYLSIAVEFDNGLDLTYMWSSRLAVDTIFQCPLPWWDQRETHWVLRTPQDGLGLWLNESRPLRADYIRAIGGEPPKKVVAVWLIANSAFQGGVGRCRYREINLRDSDQTVRVF